jgi:hypothetical protein
MKRLPELLTPQAITLPANGARKAEYGALSTMPGVFRSKARCVRMQPFTPTVGQYLAPADTGANLPMVLLNTSVKLDNDAA